jgi:pimeloyl-ACP methyl ester carboxylesterase
MRCPGCRGWRVAWRPRSPTNFGPRAGVLARARSGLQDLCESSGDQVSLIGWSLGGVHARELAKEFPQFVRCVITLGTPFAGQPKSTNAWRVYELASGRNIEREAQQYELPTTSIWSRSDGIGAWQGSVQQPDHARTENIEVVASHLGLGLKPSAWWAVADRLAQPRDGWQPFRRPRLFGLQGLVYPDPSR